MQALFEFLTHKYLLNQDLIRQSEQSDYIQTYIKIRTYRYVHMCAAKV